MKVLFIEAWVDVSVEALPNEAQVVVGMEVVPSETCEWGDLAQGGLINVGKNRKPDKPLSGRSCRYRVSRFLQNLKTNVYLRPELKSQ